MWTAGTGIGCLRHFEILEIQGVEIPEMTIHFNGEFCAVQFLNNGYCDTEMVEKESQPIFL